MVLETGNTVRPHASVAVQVSVTVPPQAGGIAVQVERLDVPEIRHPPVRPFVNVIVLADGTAPQATVIAFVAVTASTVVYSIALVVALPITVRPHASVAVQVSV